VSPGIRTLGWLASALALVAGVAAAEEASLRPDDFATGRAIEAPGDAPLQTLLLDGLVYRGSLGPALADLRVFNAQGQEVPHAIRSLAASRRRAPESLPVPSFRLPAARSGGAGDAAAAGLARSHGVEIELGADGAIVRVQPTREASAAPGPPGAAVLVDLTGAPREVVALELDPGPAPAEFVLPLRVEVSDDLVSFRTWRTRSALARLEQGGHRIERSDVRFAPTRARYLVLSSDGAPLPVEIRAVRARLAPEDAPPPRHQAELAGAPLPDDPGAFLFDAGGGVPIDRVQLGLPQPNSVVRARLFSGPRADGPWTRHHAGLFYRIEGQPSLRNDPVELPVTRHRYLRLEVSQQGGGLGGGAPRLEVSWHPEQLLFVRRGPAPFALGYGRADTEASRFSASELLRTAGISAGALPRESATLGAPHPVGDPGVLEPRPAPPPPYGLWAFLVSAVAVVLGLSVRLLRQMRASGGGTAEGPGA